MQLHHNNLGFQHRGRGGNSTSDNIRLYSHARIKWTEDSCNMNLCGSFIDTAKDSDRVSGVPWDVNQESQR